MDMTAVYAAVYKVVNRRTVSRRSQSVSRARGPADGVPYRRTQQGGPCRDVASRLGDGEVIPLERDGGVDRTAEQPYDFFGRVDTIKLGRVGPAEFVLADGRRLRLPPDTPGANACEALYDPASMRLGADEEMEPWSELDGVPTPDVCVVIGGVVDDRTIDWFEMLPEYHHGRTVTVGSVSTLADDGTARTSRGYRFPVAQNLTVDCRGDAEPSSLADVVAAGRYHQVDVDVVSGQIVAVTCISGGQSRSVASRRRVAWVAAARPPASSTQPMAWGWRCVALDRVTARTCVYRRLHGGSTVVLPQLVSCVPWL